MAFAPLRALAALLSAVFQQDEFTYVLRQGGISGGSGHPLAGFVGRLDSICADHVDGRSRGFGRVCSNCSPGGVLVHFFARLASVAAIAGGSLFYLHESADRISGQIPSRRSPCG